MNNYLLEKVFSHILSILLPKKNLHKYYYDVYINMMDFNDMSTHLGLFNA